MGEDVREEVVGDQRKISGYPIRDKVVLGGFSGVGNSSVSLHLEYTAWVEGPGSFLEVVEHSSCCRLHLLVQPRFPYFSGLEGGF